MPFDLCARTRRRLPLLAGGELSGLDRRSAERHVITCDDCRDHLASLNGSMGLLRLIAAEPTPAAEPLWPALSRQLREQTRRPAPWSWDRVEPRASARVGLALAAALMLGAVGVGAWSWGRQYKVTVVRVHQPSAGAPARLATRTVVVPTVEETPAEPEVARNGPTIDARLIPRHAQQAEPRPAELGR